MTKKTVNSTRIPVYRDSGFELNDALTTAAAFEKEKEHSREPEKYIYSRYRNPTVVSAEEDLMKLEACKWSLLFQSGMSAIDTALSIFQKGRETGPWLFFNEIYGGTISFVESILKQRRGIEASYFNPSAEKYNLEEFEEELKRLRPHVVYIESISNPLVLVADVTSLVSLAKKHGALVIVDNTFATPFLLKPLEIGADLVIHSATKYFSGHGNLTAGVLCGNDSDLMKAAIEYRKFVGHMISPDDAYRLQTQLKTIHLRFPRQCENAMKLASFLEKSDLVRKVWYPGLVSHATHSLAEKLFGGKGYGAMITFDFDGKDADEKRNRRDEFIKHVSAHIKLIPTLGDPDTILMPVEAVWGAKYPEPGMIRLSIGFEDYQELETVVRKALDALKAI